MASGAMSIIPATQEAEQVGSCFQGSLSYRAMPSQSGTLSGNLSNKGLKRGARVYKVMPRRFKTQGSIPNTALPLWPLASLASRFQGVIKMPALALEVGRPGAPMD